MRLKVLSFLLSTTVFLAGCTHNVPVATTVVEDIILTRTDKISGKYLLKVSPENMTSEAQFSGIVCIFSNYPIDISRSFKTSLYGTLKNIFSDIEVDSSVNTIDRNIISIALKPIDARLNVVNNGLGGTALTNVKLKAVVIVTDTTGKRLYGQTLDVISLSESDSGFCADIPNSIKKGLEDATRGLVQKIAENIGNAL